MNYAHPYLSDTDHDISTMLETIGLPDLTSLFQEIPQELRFQGELNLPPPADEWQLTRDMRKMAAENNNLEEMPCFLGAGAYDHFIPAAVHHLTGRSEFWTAYTPYQPEMSQGMLQAIFEFQSLVTGLTGMDGANASLYDGATALLEGALLAMRGTNRTRLLVSSAIHPEYRAVLQDTLRHSPVEIVSIPYDQTGQTDLQVLRAELTDSCASIVVQNPNFFGVAEDISAIAHAAHAHGAQCHVSFDPVSIGVLRAPGACGADIATGEGQPLGMPMSFGGPGLGLFAVRSHLIRQMPGRLVGETKDEAGKRGFVLTLQAREQHIRRERAASNICTNQALCALTATVHLALLGPSGLARVAEASMANAIYLCDLLVEEGLAKKVFTAPYFREFAVFPCKPPEVMNAILEKAGICGGLDLALAYPDLRDENGHAAWLIAVTEKRTREEMDRFVSVLKGGMQG